MAENEPSEINIDASTFQHQLGSVAEVLAQKVRREAPKALTPTYTALDLHVLIRQALYTYNLLFYLNADERREHDCYWKQAYSVVTLPLIRNMIDCLYNITVILQDPSRNGPAFRKSGLRKRFEALDGDEQRYGGRPKYDAWIRQDRDNVDLGMRAVGLKKADVMTQPAWPTLGQYVRNKHAGGTLSEHQQFLRTFTYGHWREYSAMAHGGFEGLMAVGMYLTADAQMHEAREKIDEVFPKLLFVHISRAALVLLCIVTELQAHFHFDGADINRRIEEVWNALMPVPEVKELYDEHYAQLLRRNV